MAFKEPLTHSDKHSGVLLCVALVLATALKIWWASHSIGSVDAIMFQTFAAEIEDIGLTRVYQEIRHFNHTPLTAAVITGIYKIAKAPVIELPASAGPSARAMVADRRERMQMQDFVFWLRMMSILMDVVVVLAIYRFRHQLGDPPLWSLLLLALSPVSLMISGFHGNIDGVMVGFLLLAVLATIKERPILSAVLFGVACNVKLAPLPLAPLFFFFWWPRGAAWRFAAVTVAVLVVGFLWGLVNCPAEFTRNVFGYASYWGNWGITLLVRLTGWAPVQELDFLKQTAIEKSIMQGLKVIIVAGIAAIGWHRRNKPAATLMTTFALAWLWFFIFAPGVGTQYLVWLAPFLALAAPRAYVAHLVTATIFLATFYSTCDRHFPWVSAVPRVYEHPAWSITSGICWLTFVGILASSSLSGRTRSA